MAENPWLKGCGIGCAGCGALVVLALGVALTLAPRAVDRVQSVIDRQQWLDQWQGPEPEDGREALFPERVAGLSRGEITSGAGPAFLDLEDQELFHAVYSGDDRRVEAWCRPALPPVREELFARVSAAVGRSSEGVVSRTQVGPVLTLAFGRPTQRVSLWWGDDWLFVFYAEDGDDLGAFGEELLRAIERGGGQILPLEPE